MKLPRLFAILLLLLSSAAQAQPYYFRHYQVENGLSNTTVFCSVQDRNGFLWFGTKDGLNRFDGFRFKTFNLQQGNGSTLSGDQINSLLIDDHGTLWVGAMKGLYRFDAQKEKLTSFIDSLSGIYDIHLDRINHMLWFTSNDNVCRFDLRSRKLKIFPSAKYIAATSIAQTGDGNMWFSSSSGFLYRFSFATEQFEGVDMFVHSPAVRSHHIEKIQADQRGSIYVGTSSSGIKVFDVASGRYTDLLSCNDNQTPIFVRDILQYDQHQLWFATESGLFIYDQAKKQFTRLKKNLQDPYSISDNAVYCLYKDVEGGVWAGTFFGGVNYIPKQYSFFQKFFPDPTHNSISGNVVREIVQDDFQHLWMATEDGGLEKLNLGTGSFENYFPTGENTSIAYWNIHGLMPVGKDLWIGTFENGLDIMDIASGKVRRHFIAGPGPFDLKSNFVVTMLESRDGTLYIGSSAAVYKYLPGIEGFERIATVPDRTFISALIEDHEGTIWTGTHTQGVFFFNPRTGQHGHLMNQPDNRNSLPNNTINAIFEDSRKNIWFATEGGGVCILDAGREKFSRITATDGLPSNFAFKVLEDDQHFLWITTSKGLVKLDPRSGKTVLYTKENGLLNDQFNYNSGYKDEQGRLYFGSVKGMIRFQPSAFTPNLFTPPVYITGFQVHNKELTIDEAGSFLDRSILYTSEITLPYDQSSFSIDFAAPSFTSPERTEYSYMMNGLDKNWTTLPSNRKVYYTNLSPGRYTFRVKAATNAAWSDSERKLSIVVLPPWWATHWAYAAYILLGATLLYYLVSSYHKLQEDKKEKEIYEAKIEFFTHVAHEIRTPLTLIKGPVENLSEVVDSIPGIREDVATMERNTNRLMGLVNQILDFRQTEAKGFSLDFTRVNINQLLSEAYVTFRPLAKKRNLDYHIDLPASDVFAAADEEALLKIFTNLFNNAVKYAERRVAARLIAPLRDEKIVVIEIENDGFLIPYEYRERIFEPFFRMKETMKQKGTGIGLALSHTLAELHGAELFLKEPVNGLNTFEFRLPLSAAKRTTAPARKQTTITHS